MGRIYFAVKLVNLGDSSCVFCCVLFKSKSTFEADMCLLLQNFKGKMSNFSHVEESNFSST